MEKRGYTLSNNYQQGTSYFKQAGMSNYTSTGNLGITTDPRNANILQEVFSKLSAGVKHIEVEMVIDGTIDKVPKQQWGEVRRAAKLAGAEVSVHGPVIDTAGINQRSGGFSETNRELSERKIIESLERSHDVDPEGNVLVNFHSAEGIPGSEFKNLDERKFRKIVAVNRETGQMVPVEEEERFTPGPEGVEEDLWLAERKLDSHNKSDWENSLFQVDINRENAERILKDVHPIFLARYTDVLTKKIKPEEISQEEEKMFNKIQTAYEFTKQANKAANSLFERAYKFAKDDRDQEKIEVLNELAKEYSKGAGIVKDETGKEAVDPKYLNPLIQAQTLARFTHVLGKIPPKTFVPIEEFAVKQSAKTYGNAAFEAYKKFGKTTPITAIENPPVGFALSTGEDVKNLVEASQEQFVKLAKKPKEEGGLGLSEKKAMQEAEKLIGATLDVGHMNMLRRQGFKEKDIIKESEKMAPFLKHLHLSDNFGLEHTELPIGMGNVPTKEIYEHLKKKGVDIDKMKQIIEGGDWWATFRSSPVYATLEGMGSPIYSTKVSPYWSQAAGLQQNYFGGYGQMLPQKNFQMYGAGFSQLPAELGGQTPGGQGSRMSGNQME